MKSHNLSPNILALYGEYKGSQYIDFQNTILEQAKPKTITFGNKNKTRQLLINIHNPIFYNKKEALKYSTNNKMKHSLLKCKTNK